MNINESVTCLLNLGQRLRAQRLARNDTMAVFAQRLSISEATVRAMERGAPTVQIGAWINALWVLDRLADLDSVLSSKESLIDQARAQQVRRRQRASRPRNAAPRAARSRA
jgi:transcriptional regulator with XRE-family HTH domain